MLTPQVLQEIGLSAALFVFVWIVIGGKLFKPYLELLIERERRTVGDQHRAIELRDEASQVNLKVESALREARVRGIAKRDDIVSKAKAEAQQLVTKAQNESQDRLERSRSELSVEVERAQREIEKEAGVLSDVVMKRVLSDGTSHTVH
jgi:F0F1-type ATP synthase membrane subunit b/b'